MNAFASECTSGCESGWTLYLEQSFLSPTSAHLVDNKKMSSTSFSDKKEKNINEEDLSMVSDASSGPPHFNEDESYFNYDTTVTAAATLMNNNGGSSKRRKDQRKSRRSEKQEALLPSFLDDTASSPAMNLCKNNFSLVNNQASVESILDYSQDFSSTHFQGRSAYQEHFGYVQPSLSGNQLQDNQWY